MFTNEKLIKLTDFHSVAVNEEKLQKLVKFQDFCKGEGMRLRSNIENFENL